eukprot:9476280-Pyramimonas_sp.AAC.1
MKPLGRLQRQALIGDSAVFAVSVQQYTVHTFIHTYKHIYVCVARKAVQAQVKPTFATETAQTLSFHDLSNLIGILIVARYKKSPSIADYRDI